MMKIYPDYKLTKQAWMPSIPSHWECERIGKLFSQRKEKVSDKDYAPLSVTKNGIVPQLENAVKTDDGDNRKLVRKGDFVINSRSDRKGSSGISMLDGSVSLINIVMTPRKDLNSQYVHYLLRSHIFAEEYYRNGRGIVADLWTTRYSEMKTSYLPVPPRIEQNQIAHYLDWQTSRINKLINAKKKQIALLEEQKQGIVNAIVLGVVSENQERKDSGVAWIGQIPAHWDAVRCKYLFTEINDRSEEGLETHLSMSQKYGLVPDSMMDERRMLSASYAGGKLCREGDLVLNRLKAHLGVFALAPMEGVISPDYTVLRPNREYILPEFAEAVLKCTKCRPELRIRVRGIVEGFWRLYTDDFNTIYIPLPPIEEQRSIMKAIAAKQEHLNKLIKAINQEIELLQEYRTRLISDVVTGQVDVRDVAIPEYEAVQELAEEEDDTFADETEMEDE